MQNIEFIDSHTAGEPTRVVLSGGPDLGNGPLSERVDRLRSDFDAFRRMVILEPRGSEALVGALLCEPYRDHCEAGVIFFNNRDYLGMCGHGAMGLAVTLARVGRVEFGAFCLDTPAGAVEVQLQSEHRVAIRNVPAYRYRKRVSVDVPELGGFQGDIAWGGNWFFLVEESPFTLSTDSIGKLSDASCRILTALGAQGITGADGAEIDHVEFFGPAVAEDADSRNFVMCPGGAYDRSPCGTGTSAKIACLAADKRLAPGDPWIQESIVGSRFLASYETHEGNRIIPTIQGEAFVTVEGRLVVDPSDPFRNGFEAGARH